MSGGLDGDIDNIQGILAFVVIQLGVILVYAGGVNAETGSGFVAAIFNRIGHSNNLYIVHAIKCAHMSTLSAAAADQTNTNFFHNNHKLL